MDWAVVIFVINKEPAFLSSERNAGVVANSVLPASQEAYL